MTNDTSSTQAERIAPGRVAALWVLVILIALPALVYAASWVNRRSYESKLGTVVGGANQVIEATNAKLGEFKGDPAEAESLATALTEAADQLSATSTQTAQLDPPDASADFNADLAQLYADQADFYRDLSQIVGFIRMRAEALDGLAGAIDGFSRGISTAKSERELLLAAGDLETSASQTLEDVRELPDTEIMVYSTKELERLLEQLSTSVGGLKTAVRSRNSARAVRSIQSMQAVFTADWQAALFETNRTGLDLYADRLARLEERRSALSRGMPAARQ